MRKSKKFLKYINKKVKEQTLAAGLPWEKELTFDDLSWSTQHLWYKKYRIDVLGYPPPQQSFTSGFNSKPVVRRIINA